MAGLLAFIAPPFNAPPFIAPTFIAPTFIAPPCIAPRGEMMIISYLIFFTAKALHLITPFRLA